MTHPILTVIPLAKNELTLARSLLSHLATQPPIQFHAVLFVADHGLDVPEMREIQELAQKCFPGGGSLVFAPIAHASSYPEAHNIRFETALRHVSEQIKTAFLYMSPRCVPTRRGWLLELEGEYGAHMHKKPMLGQVLSPATHGTAAPLVASTAIYPHDLPKRVMQRLISQRGVDFERSCADLFVPITHPSSLIWTQPLDGKNTIPTPPPIVSLVHTARSVDYAALLRGKPQNNEIQPQITKSPREITKTSDLETKSNPPSRACYYHSGNIGDVVYALAAIRLAGGGKILLGPKQKRTPPPSSPIREDSFDFLKPLLDAQPYIESSTFFPRHPGTDRAFDLNLYRTHWSDSELRKRTGINNLARMHAHTLNVDEQFYTDDAWLYVPPSLKLPYFVVHRSNRYRAADSESFPWPLILNRYASRMLFVGLPSEHAEFQRTFNAKIAFWQTTDALEMAKVIRGSLGFIGNQSFPCALAIASGQRVLQEKFPAAPDCLFPSQRFLTQPFTESSLSAWESSPQGEFGAKKKPLPSQSRPLGGQVSIASRQGSAQTEFATSTQPLPTLASAPIFSPAAKLGTSNPPPEPVQSQYGVNQTATI